MRWPLRIALLVTLVALLAMHGIDATATASHGADDGHHATTAAAPAASSSLEHDMAAPDAHGGHDSSSKPSTAARTISDTGGSDPAGGLGGGLHHAAAACMVAIVTAVVFGTRRITGALRLYGQRAAAATAELADRIAIAIDELVPHPPPPAWLRLCVIRH